MKSVPFKFVSRSARINTEIQITIPVDEYAIHSSLKEYNRNKTHIFKPNLEFGINYKLQKKKFLTNKMPVYNPGHKQLEFCGNLEFGCNLPSIFHNVTLFVYILSMNYIIIQCILKDLEASLLNSNNLFN